MAATPRTISDVSREILEAQTHMQHRSETLQYETIITSDSLGSTEGLKDLRLTPASNMDSSINTVIIPGQSKKYHVNMKMRKEHSKKQQKLHHLNQVQKSGIWRAFDSVQNCFKWCLFNFKAVLHIIIFTIICILIFMFQLEFEQCGAFEQKEVEGYFIQAIAKVDGATEPDIPGVGDTFSRETVVFLFKRSQVLESIRNIVDLYYKLTTIATNDFNMYFNSEYQNFPRVVEETTYKRNIDAEEEDLSSFDKANREKKKAVNPQNNGQKNEKLFSLKGIKNAAMKLIGRPPVVIAEEPEKKKGNTAPVDGINTISERHFTNYYDYIRYLFEINNISDVYHINETWILPPTMILYNYRTNSRIISDVSENTKPIVMTFKLEKDKPLGPLEMEEEAIPEPSADIKDEDNNNINNKNNINNIIIKPTMETEEQSEVHTWMNTVCGPKLDHYFPKEGYYLPCRLPPKVNNNNNINNILNRKKNAFTKAIQTSTPLSLIPATQVADQVNFVVSSDNINNINNNINNNNVINDDIVSSSFTEGHHITPYGILGSISDLCVKLNMQHFVNLTNAHKEILRSGVMYGYYKNEWFNWTINICYNFESNGLIKVNVAAKYESRRIVDTVNYFLLVMFLGVIVVWDVILRVRSILRYIKLRSFIYTQMKMKICEIRKRNYCVDDDDCNKCKVVNNGVSREPDGDINSNDNMYSDNDNNNNNIDVNKNNNNNISDRISDSWEFFKRILGCVEPGSRSKGDFGNNNNNNIYYNYYNNMTPSDKQEVRYYRKQYMTNSEIEMEIYWHLWAVFSDTIIIIYVTIMINSAITTLPESSDFYLDRMSLGVAALTCSILFVSYFRNYPKVYFMIQASSAAVPKLLLFLIGVAPVFIAYTLFMTCVTAGFSPGIVYTIYDNMISLYAAWWGDNLLNEYQQISNTSEYIIFMSASIMYTSFIVIFMWGVLNIGVAIVSDSYEGVRQQYGLVIGNHGDNNNNNNYNNNNNNNNTSTDNISEEFEFNNINNINNINNDGETSEVNLTRSISSLNERLLSTKAKQRIRERAIREIIKQLKIVESTTIIKEDNYDDDELLGSEM